MWLCKSSDYATLMMVFLSQHADCVLSSTEIARRLAISQSMVVKLLKRLSRAHLLVAERGHGGGYRLARKPEQISLADVICAVEEIAVTECSKQQSTCQLEAHCPLRSNWLVINRVLLRVLQRIHLADMLHPLSFQKLLEQKIVCS